MAELALAIVGVGVSIPGVIETCLTYHRFISRKLNDISTAEAQLKSFSLYLDLSLSQLGEILALVDLQSRSSSLDPRTSSILLRVLIELHELLAKFNTKLSKCFEDGTGEVKRLRYTFSLKPSLEQFQKEIDIWKNRLSDRLLIHWMKVNLQPPQIMPPGSAGAPGEQLPRPQPQLNPNHLPPSTHAQARELGPITGLPNLDSLEALNYSSSHLGHTPDGKKVIVQLRHFRPGASFPEKMFIKQSNRNIANMLINAYNTLSASGDPSSKGMLECAGFFSDDSRGRCGIVSKLPDTLNGIPNSLQSLLWNPDNARRGSRHDLNDRIALARSIAFGTLAIHSAKFVHKNIRPSNILVLEPEAPGSRGYPYTIGRPLLVGFEDARPDEEETERRGSIVWHDNIYRHPQRQGMNIDYKYNMMHDIYSLGVIFTEIAFWRPSIVPKKDGKTGRLEIVHNPDFWGGLLQQRQDEADPEKIRELYLKLVRSGVSKHIGGRFSRVIETCLTCLDEANGSGVAEEARLSDADIGVAFLERVIEALEAICL